MKIPPSILDKFDRESEGIKWGEVSLKVRFKEGEPIFFIDRQLSFLIKSEQANECPRALAVEKS